MKKLYILILASLLAMAGCSDVKDDIVNTDDLALVHPDGFAKYGSDEFHSEIIKELNWDLTKCQACHGSDYSGGIAGSSCLTCHDGSSGPEGCATCHGSSDHSYPPRDLDDNTDVSSPGVGLHAIHMESDIAEVSCFACHPAINFGDKLSHIDGRPAEVLLSFESEYKLADGAYKSDTHECSNVYCHGNFSFEKDSADVAVQWVYSEDAMTGISSTLSWTSEPTGECASCHGNPPQGHFDFPVSSCFNCHGSVVDASGAIIDSSKHINGKINYQGNEY